MYSILFYETSYLRPDVWQVTELHYRLVSYPGYWLLVPEPGEEQHGA